MQRSESLPRSVTQLLDAFRPCFSTRGFATFVALVTGLIAAPARRTVCGMLTASGMHVVWHHSRAHRFFAATRWSPDQLGLVMLRLIVGWLLPVDAPIVIAVDDNAVPAQWPESPRRVLGLRRVRSPRAVGIAAALPPTTAVC